MTTTAEKSIHNHLVALAARWLRRDHALVITEMASAMTEQPDALGFKNERYTTVVECKASRGDFLADARKVFRREPERGMGLHRYYLCLAGLISADELPDRWGLLYAQGKRVHVMRQSAWQPKSAEAETGVLLSAFRRFGEQPVQGVSVKCYVIPTRNRAALYLRIE